MREKLRDVFENADWSNLSADATRSGSGSTLEYTRRLRTALPGIFERYNVKTFLDAPCGDWNWMSSVDTSGMHYIGADISHSVIEANKKRYADKNRMFIELDITEDLLPRADMIMVRDCLFHLKWWLRWAFFENFANSDIPYLFMTMHHQEKNLRLEVNGKFKRMNPRTPPFNFEEPLEMVHETVDSLPDDLSTVDNLLTVRSMGIWSREQVQKAVENYKATVDA
ncbi:MAG: class I SAM-dependent methyltransferase [Paracoccaceae bacterium]